MARHHIRTLVCVALAALVVVAAPAAPARAAGHTFTVQRLHPKVSLAQLRDQAATVRRQMVHLKADMAVITRRYQAAYSRFAATGWQLGQTRLQLAAAHSQLDAQRAAMAARAVAMYKSPDLSLVDVLVNAGSFTDLQSDVELYNRVARQDSQGARRLGSLAQSVQALARDLEARRAQADKAKAQVTEQRSEMADRLAERSAILEDLTRRIDSLLSAGLPRDLGPVNGSYAPLSWAKALLQKLAMPVTPPNVAAITAWELAEGGNWHNSARYNPLNTTQPMSGATAMNSVGVKAYTSWAQGFEATFITLHNGHYAGILAALQRGDDAQAVADAVGSSPWGTSAFDVAGLVGR
jgi:peptidoglycan hydrolase CwlO-like protein